MFTLYNNGKMLLPPRLVPPVSAKPALAENSIAIVLFYEKSG